MCMFKKGQFNILMYGARTVESFINDNEQFGLSAQNLRFVKLKLFCNESF